MKYSRVGAAGVLLAALLLAAGQANLWAGKTKTLKVFVPQTDAKVWIDKREIPGEGTERTLTAPPLKKGKESYTITVLWEPNNYTKIWRTKTVTAGEAQITVDLTKKTAIKDHIEVRWVPTPDDIVAAMCKLGKVGSNEVVYDLGCGDGVMVVMAVEKFGARRGVGVDISKTMIEKSKEKAKEHGVADKVEFRVGDVLKVKDLSDADVVLLYMGDDINNRLRPILKKTLKPGARVVSHRFTMAARFEITDTALASLRKEKMPAATLKKLHPLKNKVFPREGFREELQRVFDRDELTRFEDSVFRHATNIRDWTPTKTERVTGKNGGEYLLHLWVIGNNEKE